jgi:hypothetical protein
MPSKTEVIEDMLACVEEEFHRVLTHDKYPNFFGGKVEIAFTTAPRLVIEIHEIGKPGPKLGQKFRKRVGPSKSAMRAMNDETTEEF